MITYEDRQLKEILLKLACVGDIIPCILKTSIINMKILDIDENYIYLTCHHSFKAYYKVKNGVFTLEQIII